MEHKISNELPPLPNPIDSERQSAPNSQPMPEGVERQAERAIETGSTQAQPPVPAQPMEPYGQAAPQTIPVADPSGPMPAAMPVIADDADLIEKEWVAKAKEIVARTRHDPYEQNKEVEKMKADYMKKRYNKDIKITED